MKNLKNSTMIARCVVAAAVVSARQGVFADTMIQAQAIEGGTAYNNVVIGHGCVAADGNTKIPVIAQSVVFPTLMPRLFVSAGIFAGSDPIFVQTTFANIPQLIQNKDIFTKQAEKVDSNGNVIGFESTEGSLGVDFLGLVPFRTAAVNFRPESCAKKLTVHVAVADICEKNGIANLWIPEVTPKFSDPNVDGIGDPAELVFNRNMTNNPFLASSNCGDGYELTLTHSPEDIDTHLPIPGYLGD